MKLSLDDPERITSRTELDTYASGKLKITAMASKDGKLWFTGEDWTRAWPSGKIVALTFELGRAAFEDIRGRIKKY